MWGILQDVRVILVLAVSLVSVFGQTRQERGKRVVDEALAALGGERFLAMQDRVESGRVYSFYRERLSGLSLAKIYTRYTLRPEPPVPGKIWVRERQSFGKAERDGAVLFTDDNAYQVTYRGARPVPAETLDRYRETTLHNVLYILRQRLGEPGLTFDYQGSDVVDNAPVDIVDITDSDNRTVTVYFSQTSKLPIRQKWVRRDPKTRDRIEEVTIFSKYRDAGGGAQWPYDIQRLRNDEKIFQIYSDSVEINKRLTDDLFLLPLGITVLKPEK